MIRDFLSNFKKDLVEWLPLQIRARVNLWTLPRCGRRQKRRKIDLIKIRDYDIYFPRLLNIFLYKEGLMEVIIIRVKTSFLSFIQDDRRPLVYD